MKPLSSRVAAFVLVCSATAAGAHGDPSTHWHDSVSSTLAGGLVAALFAAAASRLAWLAANAWRRRADARRAQRSQE